MKRPQLDDLSFNTDGWRSMGSTSPEGSEGIDARGWLTPAKDAVILTAFERPHPVADSIARPDDLEKARRLYAEIAARREGVLLDLERPLDVVLRTLLKLPGPPGHRDCVHALGYLVFPHGTGWLELRVESMDLGVTGAREATDLDPQDDDEEFSVQSVERMLARLRHPDAVHVLPTDMPHYDARFPDHPLSRARALQRRVLHTLSWRD